MFSRCVLSWTGCVTGRMIAETNQTRAQQFAEMLTVMMTNISSVQTGSAFPSGGFVTNLIIVGMAQMKQIQHVRPV